MALTKLLPGIHVDISELFAVQLSSGTLVVGDKIIQVPLELLRPNREFVDTLNGVKCWVRFGDITIDPFAVDAVVPTQQGMPGMYRVTIAFRSGAQWDANLGTQGGVITFIDSLVSAMADGRAAFIQGKE